MLGYLILLRRIKAVVSSLRQRKVDTGGFQSVFSYESPQSFVYRLIASSITSPALLSEAFIAYHHGD